MLLLCCFVLPCYPVTCVQFSTPVPVLSLCCHHCTRVYASLQSRLARTALKIILRLKPHSLQNEYQVKSIRSDQIKLHHITSHHITSHHLTPHHTTLHHTTLNQTKPNRSTQLNSAHLKSNQLNSAQLEILPRQVSCKTGEFCITGVWAVMGGANVALRAPLSSTLDPLVEVNGQSVNVYTTYTITTDVHLELYSPGRYLLHYRNR